MKTLPDTETHCRHHWLLGQPREGRISAVCRICGSTRLYPAVLDDLDPGLDAAKSASNPGVATAAGGARPSSVALLGDSGS